MKPNISTIFDTKPEQWGLRGHPYLWEDLATYFSEIPMPPTLDAFESEFGKAYQKITGKSIDKDDYIYIAGYSHGGMSSGMIDPNFWKKELIPLLLERYKALIETE